jgi:hypothetical protein
MDQSTKDNGLRTGVVEMASLYMLMVMFMKENGRTIKPMVKEPTSTLMEPNIWEMYQSNIYILIVGG